MDVTNIERPAIGGDLAPNSTLNIFSLPVYYNVSVPDSIDVDTNQFAIRDEAQQEFWNGSAWVQDLVWLNIDSTNETSGNGRFSLFTEFEYEFENLPPGDYTLTALTTDTSGAQYLDRQGFGAL